MRRTQIAIPLATALALSAHASAQVDSFHLPIELLADGVIIDMGEDIGHAGPVLRDHDGDGRTDLMVSAFRGTIEFFRNVGTDAEPRYESQGKLQDSDGNDLKFHNW
ncbi:MAG: hypothetical protein AAF726_09300 [Planctomycetota bacterium]